ncbi:MAG: hypothetical protein QOH76_321 [Thermoleophilaceae bacterium]|nr:hypothetical protein [Thermoleophilaceae bacterium]
MLVSLRNFQQRHPKLVGLGFATLVTALIVIALWDKRHDFATAVEQAPLWQLGCAVLLQIIALLTRTEAWRICVLAAGGTIGRRRLYRASSMGYVGSLVNAQLGTAARIAALRRSAPEESPRIAPLLTAEVPIMVVEGILAAIASVTLIAPLGLPWWSPLLALGVALGVSSGLRSLAVGTGRGLRRGLQVMRSLNGSALIVGLILVATFAQIARNWLMLHAVGVDVSVFDATAVLIAQVTLAQLPLGPSTGAASTVLILGPHGVAAVAAAGVLLTVTGTVGGGLFALWALFDRLRYGTLVPEDAVGVVVGEDPPGVEPVAHGPKTGPVGVEGRELGG